MAQDLSFVVLSAMSRTTILFCILVIHLFPCSKGFSAYAVHRQQSYRQPWGHAPLAAANTEPNQPTTDAAPGDKVFNFYTMENGMCPYAARTWITLLELEVPFDLIGVSPMAKEEWFLKINPRNKVPAIQNIEDGTVIYESAICNEYLSDLAREKEKDVVTSAEQNVWKLMPIDASDRAALRLLNDHVDNQLSPAQFTFLMNKDSEKDKEMIGSLEIALEVLEESLTIRGGPYLMGTDFTLADVHVLPFFLRLVVSLKHFKGYDIPQEKCSKLLDWFQLCSERESVKAASKSEEQIIEVYKKFVDMKYKFGGLNKNY